MIITTEMTYYKMMEDKEKIMALLIRRYDRSEDYGKVSEFLIRHYQPLNRDGNWLEPIWEYMHSHPALDETALNRIGLWEDHGRMVGVVHYESTLGEAFFEFDPEYHHLKTEMLSYAEKELCGVSERNGCNFLNIYVNEFDSRFQTLVRDNGYARQIKNDRPMSGFDISKHNLSIELPDGFQITSLQEEPDWEKVHRVLWQGFDHGEVMPLSENDLDERRKMFVTPKAKLDLKIAVKAPNGEFAAICGMFYEPDGQFALVEPVATVPIYRRMGLGKAAVLEGIKRCAQLGAKIAYVGSDLDFYKSIGFRVLYTSECWVKE
jgi:GNAT superfamily N-acetyltransferase